MTERYNIFIEHAQLTCSDNESLQESIDFINQNSKWFVSYLEETKIDNDLDHEYPTCNLSVGPMPYLALRAMMRKVLLERLGIPDLGHDL